MKIHLLPGTIDELGRASRRQHLTCFVIDDCAAIDAGSLAFGATDVHREQVRDVILTHAHLDHIAGLPIFIDDLFAVLREPVRVHALPEVIEILEANIFNWQIYPRFSELHNKFGDVMRYSPINTNQVFTAAHLEIRAVPVNHRVPSVGFIVSDGKTTAAFSSDTAPTNAFWQRLNDYPRLDAVFLECSFPNEHAALAADSHHLTPLAFQRELAKLQSPTRKVFAVNLKPMYREQIIKELFALDIANLQIAEPGEIYDL